MSSEAKRKSNRRKALAFWRDVRKGLRTSPGKSRLTPEQIIEITKAKAERGLLRRLSDKYKVSISYISYIRAGKRLKNHAKNHAKAKTKTARG